MEIRPPRDRVHACGIYRASCSRRKQTCSWVCALCRNAIRPVAWGVLRKINQGHKERQRWDICIAGLVNKATMEYPLVIYATDWLYRRGPGRQMLQSV